MDAPARLVDHVVVAGSDLAALRAAFADSGLPTEYGGPHSNGVTHMDVLCFADGSYIELISTLEPGVPSPLWPAHVAGNGGPAAWCVEVPDVAAEVARVKARSLPATQPFRLGRRRPDGQLAEWDMAGLGDGALGSVFPFVIRDVTPRELRVRPTLGIGGGLLGVAGVVLLVTGDQASAFRQFSRVYGWTKAGIVNDPAFGAVLIHFSGTAVTLASGISEPLRERLARFGPSPCAYLLAAADLDAARRHFRLSEPAPWFGRRVAWFDPARLAGVRLGVVG